MLVEILARGKHPLMSDLHKSAALKGGGVPFVWYTMEFLGLRPQNTITIYHTVQPSYRCIVAKYYSGCGEVYTPSINQQHYNIIIFF